MSPRFAREADIDCIMLAGRYTLIEQGALDEPLPLSRRRARRSCLRPPSIQAFWRWAHAREQPTTTSQPGGHPRQGETHRGGVSRHGVELAAAALQFPLAHPRLASIVAGATKASEVRENVTRMSAPIPRDLWQELKHEGLLAEAAPVPADCGPRAPAVQDTVANDLLYSDAHARGAADLEPARDILRRTFGHSISAGCRPGSLRKSWLGAARTCGAADGWGQEPVLPDPVAGPPGSGPGRVAADCADGRPGGGLTAVGCGCGKARLEHKRRRPHGSCAGARSC